MKTPSSSGRGGMRKRSPSRAPPLSGLCGSQASTATVWPCAANLFDQLAGQRALADAAAAGEGDDPRRPGRRPDAAQNVLHLFAARDEAEQAGQGRRSRRRKRSSEVVKHGAASAALLQEGDDVRQRRAGAEDAGHAHFEQFRDVRFSGMMPPTRTPTCPRPASRSSCEDARHQGHVGAAEEAEAEPVGVLVGDGADDGLGRLPQAGVDDVHAGVAQGAGHDLDAAVVAVEADLGEHDADGGSRGHQAFLERVLGLSGRRLRIDLSIGQHVRQRQRLVRREEHRHLRRP